ncbi:related to WD repeat-containing protein 48 [Cephalotrichum gorgonifer]|uniref:Related to WD repeat-containing protein 48 n=1 Tax=Cephalotrichum gorgonifer TaxID=2041049 RepID=A0AAE8N4A5_9PEZI|nr:related to WD repeat-containing protein 48 [Cephalotrichum gorgonifer]
MATKKIRQRISYVIESPKASAGHKLGVNGLAVDAENSILYSGGRDGVVCAWDLNLDLKRPPSSSAVDSSNKPPPAKTTFRSQTRAHMAWVNDIVLAQNNTALVSGSSDLTVKVWRPRSEEKAAPQTIGEHADYVKCLATPPADMGAPWVASGGLDRRIYLWDLNGNGKILSIDTSGEEKPEKGSVYALSAGRSLIANGGPESIVRLWDPKSGKKITKFVGHTGNIRAILVNDAGDHILTGSSDQTIKLWSVTAGRCMYTFTMHNESVWSLFSQSPDLGVFYSSDRSGLVVKTDVRGSLDHMDDGLSLAVAKETDSVNKVVACQDHIWTATASSSINRWTNVPTGTDIQLPEVYRRHYRASSSASRSTAQSPRSPTEGKPSTSKEISPKSILRISNTAFYPPKLVVNESSGVLNLDTDVEPIYQLPEETIEGQFGLVKCKLMSDRRRALTVDTAGEVVLWDLIQCKPIQSFGKRYLEDVEPTVNTVEAVAPWCSIDTSSGSITVTLDPFNCFDAEVYADELGLENAADFREDQRINLGKWVLRYLFAGVIDEEIRRDSAYRKTLNEAVEKRVAAAKGNPAMAISLPERGSLQSPSLLTPRASGSGYLSPTPGLSIGHATPHPVGTDAGTTPVPGAQLSRASGDNDDYFTSAISPVDGGALKPTATALSTQPGESAADSKSSEPDTEKDKEKEKEKEKEKDKDKDKGENGKGSTTPFGKKFRMGMSFGSKKTSRSASTNTDRPVVTEEKTVEESEDSLNPPEKEVEDNFLGVVQRIRNEYEKHMAVTPDVPVESGISPSPPIDTPVLNLPRGTKVIVKEETSGESSNVYIGTIESVGRDTDIIEQKTSMWLGDLLLLGQTPFKDPVKVSFVLLPYQDELPPLPSTDNNNRLNANRMLRVRKILAYVAERLDLDYENPETVRPGTLKPEEYLELYCNEQVLPNMMTLATLRAHVWKGGTDVVLHYRANGRKQLRLRAQANGSEVGVESGAAQSEGGDEGSAA